MKKTGLLLTRILTVLMLIGTILSAPQAVAAVRKPNTGGKTSVTKQNKMENTFKTPDFAFPKTVEKNAEAVLGNALTQGRYKDALIAVIQIIVARQNVSRDNVAGCLSLCDSIGRKLPQPYAGLADLIQARLLTDMYESHSWQYDSRSIPAGTVPENPDEWSTVQFRDRITALAERSMTAYPSADKMNVNDLTPLLENTGENSAAGLTAGMFMRMYAVELLSPFRGSDGGLADVIPFRCEGSATVSDPATRLCGSLEAGIWKNAAASSSPVLRAMTDAWLCDHTDYTDATRQFLLNETKALAGESAVMGLYSILFQRGFSSFGTEYYDEDELESDTRCEPVAPDSVTLFGHTFPHMDMPDVAEFYGLVKSVRGKCKGQMLKIADYILASLSSKSFSANFSSKYLPSSPFDIKVKATNVSNPRLLIYRLPDNFEENSIKAYLLKGAPDAVIPVEMTGEIPFSKEVSVTVPALEPGVYAPVLSETGNISGAHFEREATIRCFRVTGVTMFYTKTDSVKSDNFDVFAVDAANGNPVANADVWVGRRNRWNEPYMKLASGLTDRSGRYRFSLDAGKDSHNNLKFKVSQGKNRDLFTNTVWTGGERKSEDELQGQIFTDLSIYHPGDTLNFAVVVYEAMTDHSMRLRPGLQVKATLRDPNMQIVDTVTLTTDSDARVAGSFRIPKEGLLGRFRIDLDKAETVSSDRGRNRIAGLYVEVAEYKTPTFRVVVDPAADGFNAGDEICFRGEVQTYSGMPLAGVRVDYEINYTPFWFFLVSRNTRGSYGDAVTTGPDGKFEIKLPTAGLRGTPYERGLFVMSVRATSPAGETQEAPSVKFAIGDGLAVSPRIDDRTEITGDSVRLEVPVLNALRRPVVSQVEYLVTGADGVTVASGEFTSPSLILDSSVLPSGKYTFKFHIKGEKENCNGNGDAESTVIFWRRDDSTPPVETSLWVPVRRYESSAGAEEVEITIGSAYPDGMVYCLISCSDGSSEGRWVETRGGNVKVTVPVPKGLEQTCIRLYAIHDFKTNEASVIISPARLNSAMKVESLSFRDLISAGEKERWSFRFSVDSIAARGIPAMAVMTNKALDAIAPFSWSFDADCQGWSFPSSIEAVTVGSYSLSRQWGSPRYVSYRPEYPSLISYGSSLYYGDGYRVVKEMKMARSASFMAAGEAEYEMADMAAPTEYKMENAVLEEAVVTGDTGDEEAPAPEPDGAPKAPLRQMEMPLAFFLPMLNADGSGTVNVDFEVPDFNTTWKFQILGYDSELHAAVMSLDAVAAKKVMVQTNAPRFVRFGDKMSVSSILFNNSGENLAVGGRIELFDPISGKVLLDKEFKAEEVAPSANRSVSVMFDVPSDIVSLGIRAYATGGSFTDGEQTVVAVLPSSSPVTESTPFYLKPGPGRFEVNLPDYDADASVALQYCDNPIWYCVTALPDMTDTKSDNALAVIDALYGSSISAGIADRYPQVRQALAYLFSEEGSDDSTLISNLDKNPELKTIALSSTPWVQNASSETLRMAKLEELLDSTACRARIDALVDRLVKLQDPQGGWSWNPGMEPSQFITARVLLWTGMMKGLGYVEFSPALNAAVISAMRWTEREIVRHYKRYPDSFRPASLLNYLYVRSFFPDAPAPESGFVKLRDMALHDIAAGWRNYDIYEKATAATLLWRSARKEVASEILRSLSEYASSTPEKGVWFDNLRSGWYGYGKLITTAQVLEAYAEIEPKSEMVDGLRQWLVLSRQAEDWGRNPYLAEVINAILTSGSDWTDVSSPAEICIGGRRLQISKRDMLTGEFTLPLKAKEASGRTLEIVRDAAGPAWGGVVSRYVAPIEDIESASVPDLSVEKSIVKISDTPDGREASEGDLHVGDKVRVTLTIRCGKDMEYVAVTDERAACLEPAEQVSGYTASDGVWFYQETRDTQTNLFISFLRKGTFVISYECYVDRAGEYSLGIATAQSQYAPVIVAHSAGASLTVTE